MNVPLKRILFHDAISTVIKGGSRAFQAIYGKRYRKARAAGDVFYVDDLPMVKPLAEAHRAANAGPVPALPAPVPHPFKARITKPGRYPDPKPTIGFRDPPLSGRILAGIGETEPRRAPRTFFHGPRTPYGGFEMAYPIYTPVPALDRVAEAFWKNRRAEGPVAHLRQDVDPVALAAELKDLATKLGAVAVGCTPVTENAVHDHVEGEYLPHAIIFAHEMEREELLNAPSPGALQGVMKGYHDVNEICLAVAEHIRDMGWRAEANANLGGAPETIAIIPLAVAAGLGTMGRHGSLITRSHGSNVRLSAVLTDVPLTFDAPVDFGVEAMCADCHVCQYSCPPQAIYEQKQTVRGVERWHVDMDRCLPYFLENESCAICITVCPWSQTDKGPLTALLQEQRMDVAQHWPDPVPEPKLRLKAEPNDPPLVPAPGHAEDWWQEVEVINRIEHHGPIVELHLKRPESALPDWSAGAHIELALPSGKVRAYSLSNLPEDGFYRLGVKIDAEGNGGSAEVGTLGLGARLMASRPGNNYLVPENRPHYVLCAGGSGVTVMVPLAKRLAELGRPFEVHYSVKSREEAVFCDELRASSGGHLTLHTDRAWLETFLEARPEKTAVCVCGPRGYMDAVADAALAKGLSVFSEDFGSDVPDKAFDVILASSGETLTVPPGESIARALGRRGIEVPVSCGYGICGTCTVGVLDGAVDHRDRVLSDEDRTSKLTLCCSRAEGHAITIDI